jgi:hypothetical protein
MLAPRRLREQIETSMGRHLAGQQADSRKLLDFAAFIARLVEKAAVPEVQVAVPEELGFIRFLTEYFSCVTFAC